MNYLLHVRSNALVLEIERRRRGGDNSYLKLHIRRPTCRPTV